MVSERLSMKTHWCSRIQDSSAFRRESTTRERRITINNKKRGPGVGLAEEGASAPGNATY
jgi:hypothetical protein